MATRVATGARSAWLAGLLATVVAVPALAASDTTADRLLNAAAEPQNWLTHHKDYAATRYSTLDEITKDNVKDLKVAWTFALGGIEGGGIWPHGGLEGTPIVEDGAMYVTDGWGAVYKLDLTQGPGKLVWKMDPGTDKDWSGAVSCCGVNNRGVARWRDKVV
jgi:alcohol dehydrogenase (cytochrome c)